MGRHVVNEKDTGQLGNAAPRPRVSASPRLLLLLLALLATVGCRQDMQDQPKMKPYRGTSFFGDGLSARPPVEGTVPRGYLRTNREFFTGKKTGTTTAPGLPGTPAGPQPTAGTPSGANAYPDDVDTFPFPVTEQTLQRGQQRYNIFCSACHGLTGFGDGIVVRRGFRRAASFHDDRLRQAPVGHFFDAVTNGWGAMPSYATQIPVQDRWAIIAYIRALQLSQQQQQPTASPAAPAPSPTATPGGHPQ
ncbi:MAG TPA: cytochrome c [Pyrinomonadaceae bacterium]|nr:cytochrome c [Pyrinomonadaceae bacterium]